MNKQITALRCAAGLLVCGLATGAFAQGFPSWWGIDDGSTTSACWDFENPADPYFDSVGLNPYGLPQPTGFGDVFWDGHDIIIDGTGSDGTAEQSEFGFRIANRFDPDRRKLFWMQFTFRYDGNIYAWMSYANTQLEAWGTVAFEDLNGDGTRWRWTMEGSFFPQPEWEAFGMGAGFTDATGQYHPGIIFLEEMCFGTHCVLVPEPSGIAVLALGGMGLALRRRKR
ncbi:MAG: PEP-CTERM sorting domain-containing protein [Armatimonadetes bacterium]|nr:PEP-CTERM sorting domain-containing protein [Armatimonadota bacterium]